MAAHPSNSEIYDFVLSVARAPIDGGLRNFQITLTYFELSEQMGEMLGKDDANWCTLAVWPSRTVGTNIRNDRLPRAADRLLVALPLSPAVEEWMRGAILRARASGRGTLGRALAVGNRGVFHDMAILHADFVETFMGQPVQTYPAHWKAFERRIDRLPNPPGAVWPAQRDPESLKAGFRAYLDAMKAPAQSPARSQHIHRANLLLAQYEQRRLDPLLNLALWIPLRTFFGKHVKRLDRITTVTFDLWIRALTRWILDVQVGSEVLRLGRDVPPIDSGTPFFPPSLRIVDADLAAVLRSIDPPEGERRADGSGTAVSKWTNYEQRIRFIAVMARSCQQSRQVWARPFKPEEEERIRKSLPVVDTDVDEPELLNAMRPTLEKMRQRGDRSADDVVRRYYTANGTPEREQEFERVMAELGKRPPHAVIANYLAEPLVLPDWADERALEAGARFYQHWKLVLNLGLMYGALPETYAAEKGVRVLGLASELADDPVRRIGRTARFVLDVMAPVDLTDPSEQASRSIKGLRLFHAAVRVMILSRAAGINTNHKLFDRHWNPAWGHPVNQEDLFGTLLSFSVKPLEVLEKLGVPFDKTDAEAYFHRWLVIGRMLGLDDSLVYGVDSPKEVVNLETGRKLLDVIRYRTQGSSAAGVLLMSSLREELERRTASVWRPVIRALFRFSAGDRVCDLVGLPRGGISEWTIDRVADVGRALRPNRLYAEFWRTLIPAASQAWEQNFVKAGLGGTPLFRYESLLLDQLQERLPRDFDELGESSAPARLDVR